MTAPLRIFANRRAAGRELARVVAGLQLRRPLLVLGLPRGGVPVAFEVARALQAPLDVMMVRKVGMPGEPELALGAIAAGGITVRQRPALYGFAPAECDFAMLAAHEAGELRRRELLYRAGRPPLDLKGKTAILVDDGLATGATMLAAVQGARKAGAAAVVAAAPVSSHEAAALVAPSCDDIAILEIPPALRAVGEWYEDFGQTEDGQVCDLLRDATRMAEPGPQAAIA